MIGGAVAKLRQWWLGRDLMEDIYAVQTIVLRSCKYLPSVAGVAALLGSPTGMTAAALAMVICDEMKRAQGRIGFLGSSDKQQVIVDGVVIDMVRAP